MMEATTTTATTRPSHDVHWYDEHTAAADYLKAFGLEPTEAHVQRITSTVTQPQYWEQALALWKTNGNDPTDIDGLLRSYWQLQLEMKLTIDAVRLVRLNRALAALPNMERAVRVIERHQTKEGERVIAETRALFGMLFLHAHQSFPDDMEAVFWFSLNKDWQLQTLAGLLLCQTLRTHPSIMTDAVEHMQQALLT